MADIKLTPEVEKVLRASEITSTTLKLPPGQLERSLYEKVNKVLTTAGGKWHTGKKVHVFTKDPRQALGLLLETGKLVDEKKKFQAFFTPEALAQEVVELACVSGQRVLEPSAGEGALAKECLRQGAAYVHCIEINFDFAKQLRESEKFTITVNDFLDVHLSEQFPCIVMNPPFTKGQGKKHVIHACNFLAPGGRLVAIVPPNHVDAIIEKLPKKFSLDTHRITERGEFKESGTNVQTAIIVIRNEN